MIMRAIINVINPQKKLIKSVLDEFGSTFEKHTIRLAATAKLQSDNQKSLSSEFLTPHSESSF